ncbi:MAG: hypothetical protein JST54_24645 [Deltaproteobacteria bacterium]|nr:hypothetical protein [Deltaproteobacteria bacterium]
MRTLELLSPRRPKSPSEARRLRAAIERMVMLALDSEDPACLSPAVLAEAARGSDELSAASRRTLLERAERLVERLAGCS